MRLLLCSDIHNQWDAFDAGQYPPVDAILCAGDITDAGKASSRFCESRDWVATQAAHAPFYWIPGNHDLGFDGSEYDSIPGAICCLNRTVSLGAWRLHGVSCSPCYDKPRLAQYWDFMTADPEVERAAYDFAPVELVLSHSPPFGTCDRSWDQYGMPLPLGSERLRDYIVANAPELVVCGHIHEAAGQVSRGTTQIFNVACRWTTHSLVPPQSPA